MTVYNNGLGYDKLRKKNGERKISPYVFSGTNVYIKGKFVEEKNKPDIREIEKSE